MKVKSEIKVHEIDGKPPEIGSVHITIQSHWPNSQDQVEIALGDKVLTVNARDLIRATQNATNA